MSTRIIIEKDGERYACDGLDIEIQNKSILYVSDGTSNAMASYVTLPPVIRTDNSAVIARLEAENAKLREALKPIMACGDGVPMIAMAKAVREAQEIIAHGCASTQKEADSERR